MTLAARLKLAIDQAELYAASLMPGLVFHGAGPAAQARGYKYDTPEYRIFVETVLSDLENVSIFVDANGKIVEVRRPS